MPKQIINLEKYSLAESLLSEGKKFDEINQILKSKFGSGMSDSTLTKLNTKFHKSIENKDVKNAIEKLMELYEKASVIPKFLEIVNEEHLKAIEILEVEIYE